MNYLFHPLVLVTFFPLVGVIAILFLKEEQKTLARWTALIASLITFVISLAILVQFNPQNPDLQMVVNLPWIQVAGWNISFYLGIDGLSILLVLLTTLLTPISILSTWKAIEERVKEFMIFFLMLEIGMVGVFLSLDLFLFYVFWEFTLVPMYFLIGVWGGPRRVYSAFKFFLFTLAGSVLMLGIRNNSNRRSRVSSWCVSAKLRADWVMIPGLLHLAVRRVLFPFANRASCRPTQAP